jgi:hypothetical protein
MIVKETSKRQIYENRGGGAMKIQHEYRIYEWQMKTMRKNVIATQHGKQHNSQT